MQLHNTVLDRHLDVKALTLQPTDHDVDVNNFDFSLDAIGTTFSCDRKIPYTDKIVFFDVLTTNGAQASRIADALAYAVAWLGNALPKVDERQRPIKHPRPESWALKTIRDWMHDEKVHPHALVSSL